MERSGLIAWCRALMQAGSTTAWVFSSMMDMYQQLHEAVQGWIDDFNEYSGYQITMWEFKMAVISFMTIAALVSYFWEEVRDALTEELASDAESEPPSPTTSGRVTFEDFQDEDSEAPWKQEVASALKILAE
eukprot:4569108-Pyramimonas_sp.AAC.1